MELKPSPMVIRGPEDVDSLYALFLGRLPESAFIREKDVGQPVLELVNRIITSEEFATQIVASVLRKAPLPHRTLPLDRLDPVQDFIADAALVPPGTRSCDTGWGKTLRQVLANQPC